MKIMYRNNIHPKSVAGFFEDFLQNGLTKIAQDETHYSSGHAPVNIQETDKAYELSLIAPGLSKEAFKVNIEKNVLSISFEPKEETTDATSKFLRKEFKVRSFKRSFTLNEKIDTNSISAKYTDGILVLELPKKEVEEVKVKDIIVD